MQHLRVARDDTLVPARLDVPSRTAGHSAHIRLAMAAAILVSALALGSSIIITDAYYTDVPFWDEWLLLPLLKLDAQGQLGWVHLFAPHNEHRPIVSRLVLVALARLTRWNMWHECMLNLGLGVVTILPLWVAAWRARARSSTATAVLTAVSAVTFLSMNQWENWLWGWQAKVVLTTAGFTWAALVLSAGAPRLRTVAAAAVCGTVATFSFGNGFLVWPALLPVLWMRFRRHRWLAATWVLAAAANTLVFFWGFGHPIALGGAVGTATTARVLESSARLLGTALAATPHAWLAPLLGACGVLAVAISAAATRTAWRTPPTLGSGDRTAHLGDPTDAPALVGWTLVLLGLGTVVLIGLGRQFDASQPIPTRYMAFANLFWIGQAFVAVSLRPRLAPAALLIPLLATGTGLSAREAYAGRHESLVKWRASLFAPVDNPTVDRFFWAPGFVGPWLSDLRGLSLSVFDWTSQLSRTDCDASADIISTHARGDDVVITSNAWSAGCLRHRLAARRSRVAVVSANESTAAVTEALARRTSAFLVSGGDVESADTRGVIEGSGYPLYRSPVGSMRLFYYPGRIEYVRDRLTPAEVADDYAAFTALPDLAQSTDERFMLRGWLRAQPGETGAGRTLVTRVGAVYVALQRNAPASLEIEIGHLAPAVTPTLAISVNGTQAARVDLRRNATIIGSDLSRADWRYGSNIVEFELGSASDDLSHLAEDEPLAVFRRIAFTVAPPHLH